MFEPKSKPLASRKHFVNRQLRFSMYTVVILATSLAIGIVGYMVFADLGFIDALLNASMILTGMGPVNAMTTNGGKVFASFYAIYSGVAFLTTIGVFLSPIIHRIMHKIHLES